MATSRSRPQPIPKTRRRLRGISAASPASEASGRISRSRARVRLFRSKTGFQLYIILKSKETVVVLQRRHVVRIGDGAPIALQDWQHVSDRLDDRVADRVAGADHEPELADLLNRRVAGADDLVGEHERQDRKSPGLNSSHVALSR